MRTNFTPTLEQWLRTVPPRARLIVEARAVINSDVNKRFDDWADADSLANLVRLADGGVTLAVSLSTVVNHTVATGQLTALEPFPPSGAVNVAQVQWIGATGGSTIIQRVTVRLNDVAANVVEWRMQLFRLARVRRVGSGDIVGAILALDLEPIGPQLSEANLSPPVANYTFDYSAAGARPIPRGAPEGGGGDFPYPTTYVFVWGVQSDGTLGTSMEWRSALSSTTVSNADTRLDGRSLTARSDGAYDHPPGTINVPHLIIDVGYVAAQNIEFTTAGGDSRFNLTAVPTDPVQFTVQGETPGGSSLTGQVRNDADTAWVTFTDGQTDEDLPGVGKNQLYPMRCTLTPSGSGHAAPTLRALGGEDRSVTDLDNLVLPVDLGWRVDQLSLKGEIPQAVLRVLTDGVRDYQDAITDLLSTNDIGDIVFDLFVGHPDLAREHWCHLDSFLVDEVRGLGGAMEVVGISPLAELRGVLPVYKTGPDRREPFRQAGVTLKAAYANILGEIGFPGRFRGPDVENTTNTVSKVINRSDAKAEASAIAYLEGSAIISSQARIKVVDLHADKAPITAFDRNEIEPLSVTPGWSRRVAEFFVPYNYNFEERRYANESRSANAVALTQLGRARIDPPTVLDDVVSQWIINATLADLVANRVTTRFGTGAIELSFRTTYAHPEIEPGDIASLPTDRFVAKDPHAARQLRGQLFVLAVVVAVNDPIGTSFTVWVRSYADIVSSELDVDHDAFEGFFRAKAYKTANQVYTGNLSTVISFNAEAFDVGAVHDNVTNNHRFTVPTGGDGHYSAKALFRFTGLGTGLVELRLSRELGGGGTTVLARIVLDSSVATDPDDVTLHSDVELAATDWVEARVQGDIGGSGITLIGGTEQETNMSLRRTSVTGIVR